MRGSSEAQKRDAEVLMSSMQCLVLGHCIRMKIGHKQRAKHVKIARQSTPFLQVYRRKEAFESANFELQSLLQD